MRIRGAIVGAALGALAAAAIHYLLAGSARPLLALFLALTACVYLGALLAQTQTLLTTVGELLVGGAVFVCAFLGVAFSALWLVAGYVLHGAWDWLHETKTVPTHVAAWFPPACAAFDFVIAGFVLSFMT
ncbi:MAG: DUF6010 family protein [Acidiferrobacterales bacterium]